MLYQHSARSFATLLKSSGILRAAKTAHTSSSIRPYTTLPSLRPSLFPPPLHRAPTASSAALHPSSSSSTARAAAAQLDLVPKISAHPALVGMQVRCGPRNTFSPSHFVRKRRHGFLSRQKTRKGRATLLRRRLKRRSTLSH